MKRIAHIFLFIILAAIVLSLSVTVNKVNAFYDSRGLSWYVAWYFYSNNNSNIDYQVGFRIIGNHQLSESNWVYSPTWYDWATSSCTASGSGNRCAKGHPQNGDGIKLGNPGKYKGETVMQWGTGCVDPYVEAASGSCSQAGGWCSVWTGYNNITCNYSARYCTNSNAANIAYWEANGGKDIYFGGFGNTNNCPKPPPPPVCNCTNWDKKSCGGKGGGVDCGPNKRLFIRSCTPNACRNEGECREDISCTKGSIGGKTYIDGKVNGKENNDFDPGEGYSFDSANNGPKVQRGQITNGNFNVKDTDNPNPDYNFPGLTGGTDHNIRVIDWNNNRLNLETENPKNVRVPNDNANFRFSFKKYRVFGTVFWDPDGIPDNGDEKRYADRGGVNGKVVKVCLVGESKCADTNSRGANAGEYNITGVPTSLADGGARYTVRVSDFRPIHNVENNSQVINVKADNERVNFYITSDAPTYPVSGTIWVDNPSAGTLGTIDGSDTRYSGSYGNRVARIRLDSAGNTPVNVNASGNYTITGVSTGSHNIAHLGPLRNNFNRVAPNTKSINVNGAEIVDFLVARTAVPTYSLSGVLFDDTNDPGNRNSDPNIPPVNPERINVTSTTGYNQTFAAGSAEFNDAGEFYLGGLSAGTYTVSFTNVRNNWGVSFHPLPYRDIRIGPPPPNPSCPGCTLNGQDAEGIDFGISQGAAPAEPWIQSVGGDVRWDRNLWTNIVPPGNGNTCTANSTQPYVSSNIVPPGNLSSGIVFTGYSPVFSTGGENPSSKASPNRWLITGNPFTPSRPGVIRTSYKYVSDAIVKGRPDRVYYVFGSAPSRACTQPNPSNCNLKAALLHGVYVSSRSNEDVTLRGTGSPESYTFPSEQDYVFLIDGNLTISTNIDVPPGSTATFIVKGNIIVDSGVTRIEGIFSTDNNFTVGTTGGVDSPLVVEGNVIANAAHPGTTIGTFTSLRTLGTGANGNATCPAVRFVSRPDFILNSPELMRFSNYNIQEVAPQGGN